MVTFSELILFVHLIGLALGVGSATVKIVLLFRCSSDTDFIPTFLKVVKPITKLIVTGLILVTLSGITWIIQGYPFTTILIIKIILVVLIWVLGPIIDKVAEPKFIKLAPGKGQSVTQEFIAARKQYQSLDLTATLLFYAITVLGILI